MGNPGTFDVVVGADVNAINTALNGVYDAAAGAFSQSFPVNAGGIGSITVTLLGVPTLTLAPPGAMLEAARAHATEVLGQGEHAEAARELTQGVMTLSSGAVLLQYNGNEPFATLTCSAWLEYVPDPNDIGQYYFQIVVGWLSLEVPGDDQTNQLLDQYVAEPLQDFLNNSVFGPMKIPANIPISILDFGPAIAFENTPDGDSFLLAYAGMQPVTVPDQGTPWPEGVFFIGFDAAALNFLAAKQMPTPSGSGGKDSVTWDYQVSLSAEVVLQAGSGNAFDINVQANGNADCTYHAPWILPNTSFSGSVSGSFTASAELNVGPSGNGGEQFHLLITSVGDIDLTPDIDVPSVVGALIGSLTDAIADDIAEAVAQQFADANIPLTTVEPAQMAFAGQPPVTVGLENAAVQIVAGPGGTPLALLSAGIAISLAGSAEAAALATPAPVPVLAD